MSEIRDGEFVIELHKAMAFDPENRAIELYERDEDRSARQAMMAEILRLPALHERKVDRTRQLADGACRMRLKAVILPFPQPRWQRNALGRKG
ncbi:hypothetical protein NAC44_01775 [Allorhizobium sp. BGMRC 0089]|uniref:hypothetical protein n=1 Tax=Allorhizobium sonneratiae TaxID=2934936 RepID=UPI0020346E68|nr:hypothetical protein [Allorhizobium sonneratiae]MCM2291056.1 hypothetical protein [Allorhizobium sonneratiae]